MFYNLHTLIGITNYGFKEEILIYVSLLSILASILVIIIKNPITSVLFLIGLFLTISFYLISMGYYFIGLSYILVYIGAVSILFIFILMLINIRISELSNDTKNSIPLIIIITAFIITVIGDYIPNGISNFEISENEDSISYVSCGSWDSSLFGADNITSVGFVLYTSHSILIILTALILLLSMVGCITVTVRTPDNEKKHKKFNNINRTNYTFNKKHSLNMPTIREFHSSAILSNKTMDEILEDTRYIRSDEGAIDVMNKYDKLKKMDLEVRQMVDKQNSLITKFSNKKEFNNPDISGVDTDFQVYSAPQMNINNVLNPANSNPTNNASQMNINNILNPTNNASTNSDPQMNINNILNPTNGNTTNLSENATNLNEVTTNICSNYNEHLNDRIKEILLKVYTNKNYNTQAHVMDVDWNSLFKPVFDQACQYGITCDQVIATINQIVSTAGIDFNTSMTLQNFGNNYLAEVQGSRELLLYNSNYYKHVTDCVGGDGYIRVPTTAQVENFSADQFFVWAKQTYLHMWHVKLQSNSCFPVRWASMGRTLYEPINPGNTHRFIEVVNRFVEQDINCITKVDPDLFFMLVTG